jgi:hypothetical protein
MARARAPRRLSYPGNKYAAFHLLLCRWLRHHAQTASYKYVTLGGTEFRDAISLHFVDPELLGQALSFEGHGGRFTIASQTAAELRAGGMQIEVQRGNILTTFVRDSATPHIFFIDLLGICAFGVYAERFGRMFQNETIRESDCLIITSYLPARVGWPRVYNTFDGEFRLLGAGTIAEKQACYTRHHPSFTLYRALRRVDLEDTLALTCFGGIAYRSRAPMGVFGYTVEAGTTRLDTFANNSPWHTAVYG